MTKSGSQNRRTRRLKRSALRIGLKLRGARLRHHRSLEQIQRVTKIQKKYLLFIEQGRFSDLPGAFYLRAFIEKYANCVGLNGREFLRQYADQLPDVQDPRFVNRISRNHLLVNINRRRLASRRSVVLRYIPLMSLIAVVIVGLVGIWLAVAGQHRGTSEQHNTTSREAADQVSFSQSKQARPVHHGSQESLVRIKKLASRRNRSVYRIYTLVRQPRLKIKSSVRSRTAVKTGQHFLLRSDLRANQARVVKLPAKSKLVSLRLHNAPKTKLHVNSKPIHLATKQSNQRLTLRIHRGH